MLKRFPAVILTAIMLIQCMTCSPVFAESKSKSPALIKSVVVYNINYDTQKWEKSQKRTFTYNKKKYPKKQSIYEYDAKMKTTKTFKYTFRGKLPKKMTLKSSGSATPDKYSYTKKGLVSRITTGPDENGKRTKVFTYGAGNYFTSVLHDNIWTETDQDGKTAYEYGEELDSVAVTPRKNGLLRKTVNRGIFANYSHAEKRRWERFDGVYTVNYDKNGIVYKTVAKFRTYPDSGPQLRFKVYRENGLITKVIRYNWDPDANKGKGAWVKDQKFIFKYTSMEINKIRYASMINSQVMDESNNYYMYNWY